MTGATTRRPWAGRGAGTLAIVAAAVLAGGCGSQQASTSTSPPDCKPGDGISRTATTPSFLMVLVLGGGTEAMYTHQQVLDQHPRSGEEMISGAMAADSGMSGMSDMSGMPGMSHSSASPGASASAGAAEMAARHLEVHVCEVAGGHVVGDAQPTITLIDDSRHRKEIPVAVMRGVTAGPSDVHYGNNVEFVAGHSYSVQVDVRGESATFHIKT